jgi:hypothetical protein
MELADVVFPEVKSTTSATYVDLEFNEDSFGYNK